ncbi:hypothetical protein KJ891_01970, partial [Candidatus Micrarchaeota archaeon]|nr:hypothetical protein [Candidatus Micrarchaeota archaeon]
MAKEKGGKKEAVKSGIKGARSGKETPKEIAKRLRDMADGISKDILKKKEPKFVTMQRGKGNVEFSEKKGILELGDKSTTRTFLNIGHAKKFMQTMLVTAKTHDYLMHNKTAAIREVYYELKHTIGSSKENTFEDQTESDGVLVDLEHSVDTIREKLNLHANPKGTLYGDVTLRDKVHNNDTFNCAKLGRGGWSIMSRIEPEEIEIKSMDANYILVIETEAMYERLVEEQFAKKNRAILVSTGGQAARGTRRLIHRLHAEKKMPVYVFSVGGNENIVIEENGLIKNVKIKNLMEGKPVVKVNAPFENERADVLANSVTFDNEKPKMEPIYQVIRHPVNEELFEIKSELGYSVKATKSHSVIVYDSEKRRFLEKKPAEIDIEKDFLIVNHEALNNESLGEVDLGEFLLDESKAEIGNTAIKNRKSKVSFPRFVKGQKLAQFCRLLGYYAAEGHAEDYCVVFSFNASEREYIDDVKGLAFELFGTEAKEHSPHSTEAQLKINNVLAAGIFRNLGKTGAHSKEVPYVIFNVPAEAKKEFLSGYFRGDGRVDCRKNSSVELWAKTVSRKLAYDLVLLTSQLGATATIQMPKISEEIHEINPIVSGNMKSYSIMSTKQSYVISISNKPALMALKGIVVELNPNAEMHLNKNFYKCGKIESLPKEFVEQFRPAFRDLFRGSVEQVLPPSTFQWRRVSKEKLRALLGICEDERLRPLRTFLDNKMTLARIKEIKEVEPEGDYVYDIEMTSTHRFFANFICVHNTDGDPYGWYIYSVIKQ